MFLILSLGGDRGGLIYENTDKILFALSCLTRTETVNIKDARRRIAEKLIEENKYTF